MNLTEDDYRDIGLPHEFWGRNSGGLSQWATDLPGFSGSTANTECLLWLAPSTSRNKSVLLVLGRSEASEALLSWLSLAILGSLKKRAPIIQSGSFLSSVLTQSQVFSAQQEIMQSLMGESTPEKLNRTYLCINWLAEDEAAPKPAAPARAAVAAFIRNRIVSGKRTVISAPDRDSLVSWYGEVFTNKLVSSSTVIQFGDLRGNRRNSPDQKAADGWQPRYTD